MFGLFGKKELENSSFNNLLITALVECIRRHGRIPSEHDLSVVADELCDKLNRKFNISQAKSMKLCASLLQFESTQSELIPLLRGVQKELPNGGRKSYDATLDFLARHGLIIDDSSIEFMKKYGLK
jgi:hypothetical protein